MTAARNRRTAGNAVVEFALAFFLLWGVLAGCFKVGYSIYVYQALLSGVAGAGRYASRVDFDEPNHSFVSSVANMAVFGSPAGGSVPLAPGLNTSHISVTWTSDAKGVPATITISVTGYSLNTIFQVFAWSGKPSVTVRYAGSFKS